MPIAVKANRLEHIPIACVANGHGPKGKFTQPFLHLLWYNPFCLHDVSLFCLTLHYNSPAVSTSSSPGKNDPWCTKKCRFPIYLNSACISLSGGLVFGIVNIVGNFGTVFCDQAYWQSSVAAKPLQVSIRSHSSHSCRDRVYAVCTLGWVSRKYRHWHHRA